MVTGQVHVSFFQRKSTIFVCLDMRIINFIDRFTKKSHQKINKVNLSMLSENIRYYTMKMYTNSLIKTFL